MSDVKPSSRLDEYPKLPFVRGDMPDFTDSSLVIRDASGQLVAEIWPDDERGKKALDLILSAVNSHAALVEVVKWTANLECECVMHLDGSGLQCRGCHARSALALAEPDQTTKTE